MQVAGDLVQRNLDYFFCAVDVDWIGKAQLLRPCASGKSGEQNRESGSAKINRPRAQAMRRQNVPIRIPSHIYVRPSSLHSLSYSDTYCTGLRRLPCKSVWRVGFAIALFA